MARRRYIADLEPGEAVRQHFAVTKKALRPFRNKEGQFLSLVLSDKTGTVPANVWDHAEEAASSFSEGDIVFAEGKVEQYQGRAQLTLSAIEAADPSTVDLTEFLPRSDVDPHALEKRFRAVVGAMSSAPLRALLEGILDDPELSSRLLESPAAKGLHHARIGGLAEHIASALTIAEVVCQAHPGLDRDLVMAGVMLHDVGKVWELQCGATINYSIPGRLLGHIAIGFSEVDRRARAIPDFPDELRLQLLHIILAHHGTSEFGSPVRPMTAEAVAVHCIENCDAQVAQFEEKISVAVEEGREFTEYDPLLERYLYAGNRTGKEPGKRVDANGQAELF